MKIGDRISYSNVLFKPEGKIIAIMEIPDFYGKLHTLYDVEVYDVNDNSSVVLKLFEFEFTLARERK